MRDEDKPFVCYKRGWSMKIVPRGAAGWRAFAVWMAVFGVLLAVFLAVSSAFGDDTPAQMAAVAAFVLVTLIWAVVMIRWMLARSEIVDLKELLEIKRQWDQRRR